MRLTRLLPVVLLVLLVACEQQPDGAVGQLVSDRIEITAESTEPIVAIRVTEGDRVVIGQNLLVQDDERLRARLAEAEANMNRIEALLEEQQQGPRAETIMAARAQVEERQIEFAFRRKELQRLSGLEQRNLTSVESVDLAKRFMDAAEASLKVTRAQLQELEAGTRPEQIQQTRYSLQQAQAQLQQLQIEQQRLTLKAPVAAMVDSLPFEVGERPPAGAVVAVLLAGNQPHARVYVPETYRINVAAGDPVKVRIDGLNEVLNGSVRRIASEASFTPYFALTENDRSRLTYVAEISLPELPERLPDGVPLEAYFADMQVPDDE